MTVSPSSGFLGSVCWLGAAEGCWAQHLLRTHSSVQATRSQKLGRCEANMLPLLTREALMRNTSESAVVVRSRNKIWRVLRTVYNKIG